MLDIPLLKGYNKEKTFDEYAHKGAVMRKFIARILCFCVGVSSLLPPQATNTNINDNAKRIAIIFFMRKSTSPNIVYNHSIIIHTNCQRRLFY